MTLLGAIEAGGTKFVLATGDASGQVIARHVIPTQDPATTLAAASHWFAAQPDIAALGIGSFGPVELNRASPQWGHITDTPKPGWSQCNFAGHFAGSLNVPVGFDTDVNGAALAEYRLGAGKGAQGIAYITVGTGIGGGLVLEDRVVHGAGHPEAGHLFPRRGAGDHTYAGFCPFHGDCLEGLASGPAILDRWGKTLSDLSPEHEGHDLVAGYLAQLCHTLFAACAVERVILGGGVMQTPGLLSRVQKEASCLGAGYLPGKARQVVCEPGLGEQSGIVGALLLADIARKAAAGS